MFDDFRFDVFLSKGKVVLQKQNQGYMMLLINNKPPHENFNLGNLL